MTPDIHKLLLDLIHEYGDSLTRVQGEKDLMKCIEARAVAECRVTAKAFKTVAVALWRDQARRVQEDLDGQSALFDCVMPREEEADR